jgi:VWFA-related protein
MKSARTEVVSADFILFLILLLVPLAAISGQSAAPQTGANRQITIDVQVSDKSGAPVHGLQEQDFSLQDDKHPQKTVAFHAVDVAADGVSDPTVEVVLVVDSVNTNFESNSYERVEVKKFLLQNGGKLPWPVSLLSFSQPGVKVQGKATRDGNALATAYDQYETELQSNSLTQGGFWGDNERLHRSLGAFGSVLDYTKTRPGRKLMIWLGRGWPMLSESGLRITGEESEQIYKSIAAVSTDLRQARITVYSIDPGGPGTAATVRSSFYENYLKPVSTPSHALPGNLGLQVIALQSGGRVFNSVNDVAGAIADCVADANAFYVLTFDPAQTKKVNEYHSLEVKVDKSGATVRTRVGYYAQP